jgi:16S rRNA (guanine966-N2)-methyltransferase
VSLRIVGGSLGGRRIEAPPGRWVRPTRERVREAWFSALGARLTDARVLDLFAGSGALGIEALSRGASLVHFVESDGRAFRVLRRNLESLGVAGRARLHRGDVFRLLDRLDAGPRPDVALADPPYAEGLATRLVARFAAEPFAELLCVEHATAERAGGRPVWERTYGESTLSFFSAHTGDETGGH